jgi:hypothetical protein
VGRVSGSDFNVLQKSAGRIQRRGGTEALIDRPSPLATLMSRPLREEDEHVCVAVVTTKTKEVSRHAEMRKRWPLGHGGGGGCSYVQPTFSGYNKIQLL